MKKIQVKIYNGTMESLEEMVKILKSENDVYHFDVINKTFYNHSKGLILRPGDCYQVPLDDE